MSFPRKRESKNKQYRLPLSRQWHIDNEKINAHSLILVDIGMKAKEVLEFFEQTAKKKKFKIEEVVVCSKLGTNEEKIYYARISELISKEIKTPICIIVPGKLHFLEEEALKRFA